MSPPVIYTCKLIRARECKPTAYQGKGEEGKWKRERETEKEKKGKEEAKRRGKRKGKE